MSSDWVRCVAFDPQKPNILASGSRDKPIKIWDIESGSCLSTLTGHSERVNCVVFSPNGKVIASCSGEGYMRDNSVRLWDASTGEPIGSPLAGHTRYVPAFPCSACPQSRVVCSLFSNAQGGLGRLLRQDWEEACLMQCRQDNQDLGPDNRRAHWLAPGRAQVRPIPLYRMPSFVN